MSKFTLEFDTDNAAFQLEGGGIDNYAVGLVLNRVRDQIEQGDFHPGHTKSVIDYNGNRVGSWKFHV